MIDARTSLPTGAAINAAQAPTTRSWVPTASTPTSLAWTTRTSPLRARQATTWCERSGRSTDPVSARSRSTVPRRSRSLTARSFLGFQVSSIQSGEVLYTVPVPGFSFDPATFKRTPDHGISLSPDERELYLIDTPNGYVHVFDVSGLPDTPPRDIADIKLAHPPPNDGWLLHSRDGRYVYVGRAGDVIDTATHEVVSYLESSAADHRLPRDRLAGRAARSDDQQVRSRLRQGEVDERARRCAILRRRRHCSPQTFGARRPTVSAPVGSSATSH